MPGLRIMTNPAAINARRNMEINDRMYTNNIEKLSSGLEINRAKDGPSALIISELMRSQIASLNQAVRNTEEGVSVMKTVDASLNEVNRMLLTLRQLAVHASNEAVNDKFALEADQAEVDNILESIRRISFMTQYATKNLLDGSGEASGAALGKDLTFVKGSVTAKGSPSDGYSVHVSRAATRPSIESLQPFNQQFLDAGALELILLTKDKKITFESESEDNAQTFIDRLNYNLELTNIPLKADLTKEGRLRITHDEYGSEVKFSVGVNRPGLFTESVGEFKEVKNGRDVSGLINEELASGKGQILSGFEGTTAEGIEVKYSGDYDGVSEGGDPNFPEPLLAGRIAFRQHSINFQVGANPGQNFVSSLMDTKPESLAKDIKNKSGFSDLSEINLTEFDKAQSSILLIDEALDEISSFRANIGAIQKNSLESNIKSLKVANESIVSSESVIRDLDMAKGLADLTKSQILNETSSSMFSKANQSAKSVIQLLKET